MTTLAELCDHLPFDFCQSLGTAATLPHARAEFADARLAFHRTTESARNQSIFLLSVLSSLLARVRPDRPDPSLAILLPDVFPETSEALCGVLLEAILQASPDLIAPQHITVLSRRGTKLLGRLPAAFADIRVTWDWSSPSVLASFDLVVVMCSAIHFPLVQELAMGQTTDYGKTVFFAAVSGVSENRARTILRSDRVILPCFRYEPCPSDARFDHSVCFNNGKFARGDCVPDLMSVKRVLTEVCIAHGLSEDEASKVIASTTPANTVEAIETFDRLAIPRLNFPSTYIDFSSALC
ncbi:hypothetical protein BC831DRAFT_496209 [Entophlyctis helioformis]|nr:hypothetical protein BC831DRAFT_496209 [Entophlyctis helioformis]